MTTRGSAKMQDIAVLDAHLKHYATQSAQIIQGLMVTNNQMHALSNKVDAGIDRVKALENRQEGTSNARLRAKHAPLCA